MKIIKGIVNVLTTLIIIIGGAVLILYACGIVPYVVLSGSMEPTIKTGSLCFINKNAKFDSIKEKDVIAYKMSDGTLVTHRTINIEENEIQTKGDNNEAADNNRVNKGNFVGKNVFWIPKLGYVIVALQSTRGKIVILTFIILLFVFGFFFDDKKGNNKKESKENKEIIKTNE